MRAIKRSLNRAFTLIELMIVVAIIGVLATLAIYGVRKYLSNAKTGEAREMLGRISKDAKAAYEGEKMAGALLSAGSSAQATNTLCNSASPVPGSVPQAKKYQSYATDWGGDYATGWKCLRFSISDPQYFQYNYSAVAGSGFTAEAHGDLNGDGAASTFQLLGGIESNQLKIAPAILETDPEE